MIIPITMKMTISACVQIQKGDTYCFAWSCRLIAAIVRLIRALIEVVAATRSLCNK